MGIPHRERPIEAGRSAGEGRAQRFAGLPPRRKLRYKPRTQYVTNVEAPAFSADQHYFPWARARSILFWDPSHHSVYPLVDHQRRATNRTCIRVRNQSGVGGLPRRVTPFNTAFTLATNIPISSVIKQTPARDRN